MIDFAKKYKTANGYIVELFGILENNIFGAAKSPMGWVPVRWDSRGRAVNEIFDLVEVPSFTVIGQFCPEQLNKKIEMYGQSITVPVWAKYIFVTIGGVVYVSEKKPQLCDGPVENHWAFNKLERKYQRVGVFSDITGDIKDSLMEI